MKRIPPSVLVMCALTAAVVSICIYIEILNALAGGYLPRQDFPSEGGNPKWRWAREDEKSWQLIEYEPKSLAHPDMPMGAQWPLAPEDRQLLLDLLATHNSEFSAEQASKLAEQINANSPPDIRDNVLLYRLIHLVPLSEKDRVERDRYLAENRSDNRLHRAVETVGLLQYLLAPFALFWAGCEFFARQHRRYRLLSTICLAVTLASIAMMLYRGYFQSLGMFS